MDNYIETQCKNAIASAKLFEQACKMAAMKDGEITKKEQRTLNRINKEVKRHTKELEKIIRRG